MPRVLHAIAVTGSALCLCACASRPAPAAPPALPANTGTSVTHPSFADEPEQQDVSPTIALDGDPSPPLDCPPGSRAAGRRCVATEIACPHGSTRIAGQCVGDVTCPAGTIWAGSSCRPSTPSAGLDPAARHPAALDATACTLMINSIPSSDVIVDGRVVGQTPRMGVAVAAGTHTVVFVSQEQNSKKSVSVTCKAGEQKTVAVKLDPL